MTNWIQLRRGLRGKVGPFLEESRAAYEIFDKITSMPRLVVAIGNSEKRQFVQQACGTPTHPTDGIALRQLPSGIVADCDLHNYSELLPTNPGHPPGTHIRHALEHYPQQMKPSQIADFAQDFYWQALAPFSCVIALFARDFWGLDSIANILSAWIQRAMTNPLEAPPRLLIVCDEVKTTQHTLNRRLRTILKTTLQELPTKQTDLSSSSMNSHCRKAFESIQLLPMLDTETLRLHIDDLFTVRGLRELNFSAGHLKTLLGQAVFNFSRRPGRPFNIYHASRARNPVPEDLPDHVVNCFIASEGSDLDVISVLASALEFNAYPPGMHFFQPRRAFECFYQAAILLTEQRLAINGLTERVGELFVKMAMQRKGESSAQDHLGYLRCQISWEQCHTDKTCLVCLAQRPSFRLTCEHRLCEPCAVVCARLSSDSGRISRCPLCRTVNDRLIRLLPPTAGRRMLELRGCMQNKDAMMRFLEDLERHIGMKGFALQQHFDIVVGSDIGAYFIQTVFLEQWSLQDCAYHVHRLGEPKLDVKQSVVSFGSGLEWDLTGVKHLNTPETTLTVQNHSFYTSCKSLLVTNGSRPTDPTVHCRVLCGNDPLLSADRLLASLFYVELIQLPKFFETTERAQVCLQCRVPSGAALVALISSLRRRRARVQYGGGSLDDKSEPLVSPSALARCQKGERFTRVLTIPVQSMSSVLDIRIDGVVGPQYIGNCPYTLRKLVRDQGLDCVFGRKDHRDVAQGGRSEIVMFEAIDKLSQRLAGIIGLWATRLGAKR
ncbi:hypothetical protein BR93DRAFT_924444 [Coniochaeta sp. PMI_546]|nr:hypothetical protein BR93DRAFT_924444 [Coniochaeta sp. PMI_546]